MLQIFVSPDPTDPDLGITLTCPAAPDDPSPEAFAGYIAMAAEFARSKDIDPTTATWWARR